MDDDLDVIDVIDLDTIPLGDELATEREPMDPARVHALRRGAAWTAVALFAALALFAPVLGTDTTKIARRVSQPDSAPAVIPKGRPVLVATSFVDTRHGFALEQVLPDVSVGVLPEPTDTFFVSTSDGGRTWTMVGPRVPYARGVAFVDAQRGVLAVKGRGARYTTDGGAHWNQTTQVVDSVIARGGAVWARSGARVLRSLDGGAHWIATNGRADIASRVYASNALVAYKLDVVGLTSVLSVTRDGGASWRDIATPCADAQVTTMAIGRDESLWLGCEHFVASGPDQIDVRDAYSRSVDHGARWNRIGFPRAFGLASLDASSAQIAVASDGVNTYATTDGGATWQRDRAHGKQDRARVLQNPASVFEASSPYFTTNS